MYAADATGLLFCFDARTGKPYWVDDLRGGVRGQPLWADGKVYVGTDAEVVVYAHGRERAVVARVEADHPVFPGLVFANGTLYVSGPTHLYAIRSPK